MQIVIQFILSSIKAQFLFREREYILYMVSEHFIFKNFQLCSSSHLRGLSMASLETDAPTATHNIQSTHTNTHSASESNAPNPYFLNSNENPGNILSLNLCLVCEIITLGHEQWCLLSLPRRKLAS